MRGEPRNRKSCGEENLNEKRGINRVKDYTEAERIRPEKRPSDLAIKSSGVTVESTV